MHDDCLSDHVQWRLQRPVPVVTNIPIASLSLLVVSVSPWWRCTRANSAIATKRRSIQPPICSVWARSSSSQFSRFTSRTIQAVRHRRRCRRNDLNQDTALWKKQGVFFEQPAVRFRHEIVTIFDTIDVASSDASIKIWSTFQALNDRLDRMMYIPAAIKVEYL